MPSDEESKLDMYIEEEFEMISLSRAQQMQYQAHFRSQNHNNNHSGIHPNIDDAESESSSQSISTQFTSTNTSANNNVNNNGSTHGNGNHSSNGNRRLNFNLMNFGSRLVRRSNSASHQVKPSLLDVKVQSNDKEDACKEQLSQSSAHSSLTSMSFNKNVKAEKGNLQVSSPESSSTRFTAVRSLRFETKAPGSKYDYSSARLRMVRRYSNVVSSRSRDAEYPAVKVGPQTKADQGKLTVVLDIDETLIHSKMNGGNTPSLRQAEERKENATACDEFELVLADGERVLVNKRPGLDEFLDYVSERYEIIAYTAGLPQYAGPLLDWIEKGHKKPIFRYRLYRESCLFSRGYYVKDLEKLNRNLSRTVLVDNNVYCFLPQLSNGIPISSFYDDPTDDALNVLKEFLARLDDAIDVRPILEAQFNLMHMLKEQRDLVIG